MHRGLVSRTPVGERGSLPSSRCHPAGRGRSGRSVQDDDDDDDSDDENEPEVE